MTTSVIIPLAHHDNNLPGGWTSQCRCYPHQDLVAVLENIAGLGHRSLWWTEEEIPQALESERYHWAWIPCGQLDLQASGHYSNRMTHMKIFFKDPNHALLFKLTWIQACSK